MDVVWQLKKALECPCCLSEPKPNTTAIAICPNGHMTCEPCGDKILQTSKSCPVCRHISFKIVRGHKLAMTVIQIMTSGQLYQCKYDGCPVQVSGDLIDQHENTCSYIPIPCPKLNCTYLAPVQHYMDDQHSNCLQICNSNDNESWFFTVKIDQLYCFDRNEVKVASYLKTHLLKGTAINGYESHAYINIIPRNGGIVIYVGWLGEKQSVTQKYRETKFQLFVNVNTLSGEVGQYVTKLPKFQGEAVEHNEDGVYLARKVLYRWAEWSHFNMCHQCDTDKNIPHIHIQVSIDDNDDN